MNSRSGAALVIAIVVLAAMLLLGLPFLFTQSSSLSGTRSYSHSQLASVGQDSAQSMGIEAGSSAVSYHWEEVTVAPGDPIKRPVDDWTDLFIGLNGNEPESGLRRAPGLINRIEFDTRNYTYALPGEKFLKGLSVADRDALLERYPTMVGLAVEDESGKLDPNHLNIRAWTRLFAAVGIKDWTDGRAPEDDEGRKQLARALSVVRYQLPGGRITHLDQLLQGEPPATYGSANTDMPRPRRGLTRAELDRLRPYLTVNVPSQARGGLIDLGTVLGITGSQVTLDHDQSQSPLAFPVTPLLTGIGTSLAVSDPFDPAAPLASLVHIDPDDPDSELVQRTFVMPAIGETTRLPQPGAAVAIDAPPTINLHQAEEPVRRTFAPNSLPPAVAPTSPGKPPYPALLTDLAKLGPSGNHGVIGNDALGRSLTTFDLLSPLSVVDTRGTTHVLASRDGDRGASGPFRMADKIKYDGAEANVVLDARAREIHLITGSLDLFPSRGYARIFLNIDHSINEVIEYRGSDPSLPLSNDAVGDLQEVILRDVRRGLNGVTGLDNGSARIFPAGTDLSKFDKPADLHLTVLVPHEQQPVGIASQGIITIASTATVTDPAGNQTAQDRHRVIAQALPQETALEMRWDKQATFHALLAQRHGSLMASFPEPYPRLKDVLPQDSPSVIPDPEDAKKLGTRYKPPLNLTNTDSSVGLRPAVMRTLLSLSDEQLPRDWTLPFSGTAAAAVKVNGTGVEPVADAGKTPYSASNVTPEGLRLSGNRVLVYPNHGQDGFLRDDFTQAANGAPGSLSPIRGRQFSLWVRPDAQWAGEVTLLDMRVPNGNVGSAYSGAINETGLFDGRTEVGNDMDSNRFSLKYDLRMKQLILVLNPGVIPFTPKDGDGNPLVGFGPAIPRETYGTVAKLTNPLPLSSDIYPAVNPESLGSGGVHPMSCTSPITSIQHRYSLGEQPWVVGQWRLIQVAFSSNQPGGMSIIVDGLVGRDVSRQGSTGTPAAMSQAGDHLTIPSLVLRTNLTASSVKDDGAQAMYVETIKLDGCAPVGTAMVTGKNAVRALLPARGIVRIGNEYISYQSIDADGNLVKCVRARRQRTDAGMNSNGEVDWNQAHQMEAHRDGDLVVPGGFAIGSQSGTWWRGGCQLAQPMPDGDGSGTNRYQTWATVAENTAIGSSSVKLTGTFRNDFPPRGFVMIAGVLYFYDNTFGTEPLVSPAVALVNLFSWTVVGVKPDPADATKTVDVYGWKKGLQSALLELSKPRVVLASVELEGDPTLGNAYKRVFQNGSPFNWVEVPHDEGQDYVPDVGLIQLYDQRSATSLAPNGGRAEWLAYTSIDSRTDYPTSRSKNPGEPNERMSFLLNLMQVRISTEPEVTELRAGFWFEYNTRTGARGRQRTAFAPSDFTTYSSHFRFPAKTRVIPVQTDISIAYLLEAGDIITLTPKTLKDTERPLQMCVRYSAADAFPETVASLGWPWNVMNRFFAFTEPMPPATEWNLGNQSFHILCWPCWTPDQDLSPINTGASWAAQRLGWVLPWANAYYPNYQPTGAANERSLRMLFAEDGTGLDATIDALQAGNQPGWVRQTLGDGGSNQANAIGNTQVHVVASTATVWLDETPLTKPVAIRTDQSLFLKSHGLIEIGGEVFAYKTNFQQDDDDAKRPMNPDVVLNNQIWLIGRSLLGSVPRAHQGPELVLHLPVGPVAEVVTALPDDPPGAVTLDGEFTNSTLLLTSRDGNALELVSLPNRHSAPWLRGMYNTESNDKWVPRGEAEEIPSMAPLAIAWWPRYPSSYPVDMLASGTVAQYLRCRSYTWAGFPLRFHNCVFDGKNSGEITYLGNPASMFQLYTTALDGTLDWDAAEVFPRSESPNLALLDISTVFTSDRFRTTTLPGGIRWGIAGKPRAIDGAELRVFWTYKDDRLKVGTTPVTWMEDAAYNGSRAPMIGPTFLRAQAPNKVINVER